MLWLPCWTLAVKVTLCQMLLTVSLQLVGSTFESIVLNLQTSIIFVLALIFGQEQVSFQNFNGQAKIFGVAISVGGALTMVIWKGPAITESTLLSSSQASTGRTTFGSILVIVAVLSTCFWNILVGIMVIGLSFYAMIWCIHKRGPVFTSAFNPLFIIFSFLLETFVYKNPAHWGSIVGAVLIVSGLYLLLWAKARDAETEEVKEDEPISSPLIQS
ncbi:WAT1-related protein At1g43650-like isoform X1 [Macadamia integrifolia]|uniref:WAT1-related protein At1g43650-like isoform X1 n=1 Tax=Macadamia integrifolia TaxID=60698 RepID=UPI001C527CA2|nr:WAT1-related protein At1g43650-like isoform X1 [Macadamia integrifolia]